MVFSEKFYIGYSDINRDFGVSNTALLKIFENVSCMHSDKVGDGMRNSSARWFLRSYHVKIHKRAQHEDRVNARTWSRTTKASSASREFEILDENGGLLVTAISNWARVNMETMRPERIVPEKFACYESEPDRTNFGEPWIEKLKEPESHSFEKSFYIDRNFIDANNHMNNVFYLDLANLALPEEVYEKGECSEFEIMYKKAISYGETVKCLFSESETAYTVTVKNEDLSDTFAVIVMYK